VDLAKLELRPPDHRQPHHLAAHFTHGRGVGAPIVAVLWFQGAPLEGNVIDGAGEIVAADDAAERFDSPYGGWLLWIVSNAPHGARWIGPDGTAVDAIRRAMALLADEPVPSFNRCESVAMLQEHLYSTEPDFHLPFP